MATDHKRCDELYAQAELFVSKNNWNDAQKLASNFIDALLSHFKHEEEVLFPTFEEMSGMQHGPTEMMRHEHEQMRALVNELKVALTEQNQERYLGISETLLIYMQQHNMKEEQILYPMIDEVCAEKADKLTENIRNNLNNVA